ncbi:hypothetical protein Lalb_Chr11g0066301 [Lupinus albus]|uniref:Uncharacterized protein n=1 Tax=Lupinus albus TaxID=3870 RepID=A0A6A4PQQ4_LUPAL|nr:hypothetical protein Lalb_Chr11g0066301 [Lupinus albus]
MRSLSHEVRLDPDEWLGPNSPKLLLTTKITIFLLFSPPKALTAIVYNSLSI